MSVLYCCFGTASSNSTWIVSQCAAWGECQAEDVWFFVVYAVVGSEISGYSMYYVCLVFSLVFFFRILHFFFIIFMPGGVQLRSVCGIWACDVFNAEISIDGRATCEN